MRLKKMSLSDYITLETGCRLRQFVIIFYKDVIEELYFEQSISLDDLSSETI